MRRFAHSFSLIAGAAALAILGLSAFIVWKEWRESRLMAQVSVLNTARVLAHQVESSFQEANALLESVAQRYLAAPGPGARRELAAQVQREIPYYTLVARIGVADPKGGVVFNTGFEPGRVDRLDLADRSYFQRARAGGAGLLFEGPVRARLTGEWALSLARRLQDRDGRFLGVVFAVLPVATIGRSFSRIDLGRSGIINLRTADLAQVVRHPALAGTDREIGNRNVSRTIRDLMRRRPGQDHYIYQTTAPLDGVERVYAYQALERSPFWMTVGRATADFSTSWRQSALLLGLLSAGLGALLIWGARRLDAQHRCLQASLEQEGLARRELEGYRLRLEQRVAERTAELRGANQELDAFAYAASHDLQAPVRAMGGFARVLQEDSADRLDAEGRNCLEEIIAAAARMKALIEGLLQLSRGARGCLRREEVDLSALAGAVLEELRAAEPGRTVSWEVAAGLRAFGDRAMLGVVLRNLLGNAWKYTAGQPEARIRVYGEPAEGGTRICVADNGAGFDMAQVERLFQPFQRLHREDEFPGLGIGLATVKRVVRRHGGTLEAEARPGAGATFRFTIPDPVGTEDDPSGGEPG